MTTGEKIRHYRKLRGLYQGELGERIGVSEGAIRHYETDFRTPKQPQIEAIAEALDISPLALKDFGVENARDLLGLLLQLEDEFGIVPAEDGSGLSIDASAEKAPKTTQMLKAWAAKRNELERSRRRNTPTGRPSSRSKYLLKREQVALPPQLGVKHLLFLCPKPTIRSVLKPLESLGGVIFYSPLLTCGFAEKPPYFAPLSFS